MKYFILLMIVLLLAGCTQTTNMTAQDNINEENTTEIPETNAPIPVETFAISPGDFETGFVTKDLVYVASEENEFGDESSVRNIAGTTMYEANARLTFSYQPLLSDTTFYLKILGYGYSQKQDNTIYSGELTPGEKTIPVEMLLLHPAQEARLLFCFGFTPDFDPLMDEDLEDVVCISRLLPKPNNQFSLNTNKYALTTIVDRETATAEKKMFFQNTGNTALTVFIYIPESKDYNISTSPEKVFMLPDEQKTVMLSVNYPFEENKIIGKEEGGVYILPKNCEPSQECYNTARFKNDIEVEIK